MKLYCQICETRIDAGHLCSACESLSEEEVNISKLVPIEQLRRIWKAEDKYWEELNQWRR